MTDRYVSGTGNDSGEGPTGSPWRSLQYANDHCDPGDTIYVRTGNYSAVKISQANTTWEVVSGNTAKIDGGWSAALYTGTAKAPIMPVYPKQHGMALNAGGITVDGFTIQNMPGNGVILNGTGTTVQNCRVHFTFDEGIIANAPSAGYHSMLIYNNVVTMGNVKRFCQLPSGIGGAGMKFGNTKGNVIVRDNTVAYCYGEGIDIDKGMDGTNGVNIVEGNIVHDCDRCHLYMNRAQDVIVRNNILFATNLLPVHKAHTPAGNIPPGLHVVDEAVFSFNSYNVQVYNNLVIGLDHNTLHGPQDANGGDFENVYFGFNTFISTPNYSTASDGSRVGVLARTATGATVSKVLFENNIILTTTGIASFKGTAAGRTWRNNAYNVAPADSKFTGGGDQLGAIDLTNPYKPILCDYTYPRLETQAANVRVDTNFNIENYYPKTANASPVNNAGANRAVSGVTIPTVPFSVDMTGATRTTPDIGALEYGGLVDRGTVTASFTVDVSSGTAPLAVTVDENFSTTVGTMARWTYEWGDGTSNAYTTSANRTHTYVGVGTFTLKVTGENSGGVENSTSTTITVSSGGATSPIVVDVAALTLPTTLTTLTGSYTGLNEQVPKVVLNLMTGATALNTDQANVQLSVGLGYRDYGETGSDVEPTPGNDLNTYSLVNSFRITHGYDFTNDFGYSHDGPDIIETLTALGERGSEMYSASHASESVSYQHSTSAQTGNRTFDAAYKVISLAMSGNDMRSVVDAVRFDTSSGSSTSKLTLPFQADLVFVSTSYTGNALNPVDWPIASNAKMSFGMAVPGKSWVLAWSALNMSLLSGRVAHNQQTTYPSSVGIDTWDSTGITFRVYGNTSGTEYIKQINVLAIRLKGNRATILDIKSPSVSSQDYAAPWTPGLMLSLVSQATASGSFMTGATSRNAGIFVTDGSDDYTASWRMRLTGPVSAYSRVSDGIYLSDHVGASLFEGTAAFGENKVTINRSSGTTSGYLWPTLLIESTSTPSGSIADFSISPTEAEIGDTITFTDKSAPSGTIDRWEIDYGDGVTEISTTSGTFTHVYDTANYYTVRYTIQTATDTDTAEKVDAVKIGQVVSGTVWGPFQAQTVTNYSPNFTGTNPLSPKAATISHKADFDSMQFDISGPPNPRISGKYTLFVDPATRNLIIVAEDGMQATVSLSWVAGSTYARATLTGNASLTASTAAPTEFTWSGYVTASNHDADSNAGVMNLTGVNANTDGTGMWIGLLWAAAIPQGATILESYITVNLPSATYDDPDVTIYGNDVDNAGVFTTTANEIYNRTRTTASVVWQATSLGVGAHNSPDISDIVQEIVDRASWASGNNMAFMINANTGTCAFHTRTYDGGNPSRLYVKYSV